MKILLHTCCAPCGIYPFDLLRQEGHEVTAYFFNPNIHPYTEFRRRKETLEGYAQSIDLPLIVEGDYELEEFLRQVAPDPAGRCPLCYRLRLQKTAEKARELGMDGFSTTLLISPYQDHEALKRLGEEIGRRAGVPFIYYDFRPGFREGQQQARQQELYRQPYCGCIYSEKDRYYRPKGRK
ncbi:epoxyqueuosine reductase QueH [Heliobacterium chlorum]|uniref:Epoxyqueuosine reductase QueH n=1 Tax=Heliobacterium chlorum TaxID=2698 RepID=A0ABR7T606_HELCL|nr:epoxyqueuosine reductase QueH [Heliobacterium chlorum]